MCALVGIEPPLGPLHPQATLWCLTPLSHPDPHKGSFKPRFQAPPLSERSLHSPHFYFPSAHFITRRHCSDRLVRIIGEVRRAENSADILREKNLYLGGDRTLALGSLGPLHPQATLWCLNPLRHPDPQKRIMQAQVSGTAAVREVTTRA